jgi:hypothetical protein
MTRKEAMFAIERMVRDFCADDVKDWLAEVYTVRAGEERRAGNDDDASDFMALANDVAAIRNSVFIPSRQVTDGV